MAAPPPALAPFPNGNAVARANGQLAGVDPAAADRRLERCLRFHAAVYLMLGASFLLRAAVPGAPWVQAQQVNGATSAGSSAFEAAIGVSLSAAAVALVLLSFQLRRFPMTALAAARLAQAALRAFF